MEDKVYEIRESALGDPGAIGTCGFATTTLTLSMFNAGLLPEKNSVYHRSASFILWGNSSDPGREVGDKEK